MDQFDELLLHETSNLEFETHLTRCDGSAGSGSVTFLSTTAGFECDNPTGPLDLGTIVCEECNQCVDQGFEEFFPINQGEQAVMFVFRQKRKSFKLSYTVPCVDCSGRREVIPRSTPAEESP